MPALTYAQQFWSEYQSEPKVLYLDFLEAHEMTFELIEYIDEPLVNFLETQIDPKTTSVILLSDHGSQMNPILEMIKEPSYKIE